MPGNTDAYAAQFTISCAWAGLLYTLLLQDIPSILKKYKMSFKNAKNPKMSSFYPLKVFLNTSYGLLGCF